MAANVKHGGREAPAANGWHDFRGSTAAEDLLRADAGAHWPPLAAILELTTRLGSPPSQRCLPTPLGKPGTVGRHVLESHRSR